MKIAVTGSTGLIGSRFVHLLKDKHAIIEVTKSKGADITDAKRLELFLQAHKPDCIVHFASKTNVDGCELDREEDVGLALGLGVLDKHSFHPEALVGVHWQNSQSAFGINVIGTKNIVDYAKKTNTKLIYTSTDFVFDGKKEFYTEKDTPHPVNWYGMTKLFGEQIVQQLKKPYSIARTSYPYGFKSSFKTDFFWKIISLLKTKDSVSLVYDQVITPTFIDDIVYGIAFLIHKNANGLFHLCGSSFTGPYQIGLALSDVLGIDKNKIKRISRRDLYKGKAKRGFQLRLKNDKLVHSGFRPRTFEEGLDALREFL